MRVEAFFGNGEVPHKGGGLSGISVGNASREFTV